MKDNCIFCKITNGIVPVEPVLVGKHCVMIADRNPIAPHHILVLTKKHYGSMFDLDLLDQEDKDTLVEMFQLVDDYVCMKNIANSGYRVVTNAGPDAGQTVQHFHIHLLGGTPLKNDFGAQNDSQAVSG